MSTRTLDVREALNHSMPAAQRAKLGDVLNDLVTQHNALLAKMDADNTALNAAVAGANLDTNYAATLAVKTLDER